MNEAWDEEAILADITKAKGRKTLYHFTRVRNLFTIAHFDSLFSSHLVNPHLGGVRRTASQGMNYQDYEITINAHLRIHESMFAPGVTQEQFRGCLDRHVFFWPTLKDCQKMMDTYSRREPEEGFAVLACEAYPLLRDHYAAVKMSKYDSGSSPRFPGTCTYKKSPEMLLPVHSFKRIVNHTVPTKPSEIKEILVEERVNHLSSYLQAVYVDSSTTLPERWRDLAKPITEIAPYK